MTTRVVTDEQLATYTQREHELYQRFFKGVVPADRVLRAMQDMIEGSFDAIPAGPHRLIDCDATPFIPEGWMIKPEDQLPGAIGGQVEFDPAKILFHLDEGQKDNKTIIGNKLKEKLAGRSLLKANVLDHLLANTYLIPESWKTDEQGRTRYIFFWGTVYRDPGGCRCVRCLYWRDGEWGWHCRWLGGKFVDRDPAAILAS